MRLSKLDGQKFGNWVVISRDYSRNNGRGNWLCQCQCDAKTIRVVDGYSLTSGRSVSCGCIRDAMSRERGKVSHEQSVIRKERKKQMLQISKKPKEDLVGKTFGTLMVLEKDGIRKRHSYYKCLCLRCNSITIVRGSFLTSGKTYSCGCVKSIGEMKIANLLNENNIPYTREKTFHDCILPTGGHARFDFFVDDRYVIEYDGVFHYKSNNGWNDEEHFLKLRSSDKYKNEWCEAHNIPLIRIPYTRLKDLCIDDLLLNPNSSRWQTASSK